MRKLIPLFALALALLALPSEAQETYSLNASAGNVTTLTDVISFFNAQTCQGLALSPSCTQAQACTAAVAPGGASCTAGGGVGPMLEATSVSCHARRIAYARDFPNNPAAHRPEVAKHLVTQSVVLSVGTSGVSGTNNFDSAATDAALFSAISASWSAFSGCDVAGN